MSRKKLIFVLAVVFGLLGLAGFAGRSALAAEAAAPVRVQVQIAPGARLGTVSIAADHSVNVSGAAADLAGACLPVSIFVDGEREPWWPVYRCLQVGDKGEWSLRIPSDDGGKPIGIHLQVGE